MFTLFIKKLAQNFKEKNLIFNTSGEVSKGVSAERPAVDVEAARIAAKTEAQKGLKATNSTPAEELATPTPEQVKGGKVFDAIMKEIGAVHPAIISAFHKVFTQKQIEEHVAGSDPTTTPEAIDTTKYLKLFEVGITKSKAIIRQIKKLESAGGDKAHGKAAKEAMIAGTAKFIEKEGANVTSTMLSEEYLEPITNAHIADIIDESPEAITKALRYYELGKHENATEDADSRRVLGKIIKAKDEGQFNDIKISYLGGTDFTDHALLTGRTYHKTKSEALKKLIAFHKANRVQDAKGAPFTFNVALAEEYIAQVALGKGYEFVSKHKNDFLKGGTLFDAALSLQRAEDMKKRIYSPDAKLLPGEDMLTIELGTTVKASVERKSAIKFEMTEEFSDEEDDAAEEEEPAIKFEMTEELFDEEADAAEEEEPAKNPAKEEPAEEEPKPDHKYELNEDGTELKMKFADGTEKTYKIESPAGELKFLLIPPTTEEESPYIGVALGDVPEKGWFRFGATNNLELAPTDEAWLKYKITLEGNTIKIEKRAEEIKDHGYELTKIDDTHYNLKVTFIGEAQATEYAITVPTGVTLEQTDTDGDIEIIAKQADSSDEVLEFGLNEDRKLSTKTLFDTYSVTLEGKEIKIEKADHDYELSDDGAELTVNFIGEKEPKEYGIEVEGSDDLLFEALKTDSGELDQYISVAWAGHESFTPWFEFTKDTPPKINFGGNGNFWEERFSITLDGETIKIASRDPEYTVSDDGKELATKFPGEEAINYEIAAPEGVGFEQVEGPLGEKYIKVLSEGTANSWIGLSQAAPHTIEYDQSGDFWANKYELKSEGTKITIVERPPVAGATEVPHHSISLAVDSVGKTLTLSSDDYPKGAIYQLDVPEGTNFESFSYEASDRQMVLVKIGEAEGVLGLTAEGKLVVVPSNIGGLWDQYEVSIDANKIKISKKATAAEKSTITPQELTAEEQIEFDKIIDDPKNTSDSRVRIAMFESTTARRGGSTENRETSRKFALAWMKKRGEKMSPDERAQLLLAIANSYFAHTLTEKTPAHRGKDYNPEKAMEYADQAIALLKGDEVKKMVDYPGAMTYYANYLKAHALSIQGKKAEAEPFYAAAMAATTDIDTIKGATAPEYVRLLADLNKYDEAFKAIQEHTFPAASTRMALTIEIQQRQWKKLNDAQRREALVKLFSHGQETVTRMEKSTIYKTKLASWLAGNKTPYDYFSASSALNTAELRMLEADLYGGTPADVAKKKDLYLQVLSTKPDVELGWAGESGLKAMRASAAQKLAYVVGREFYNSTSSIRGYERGAHFEFTKEGEEDVAKISKEYFWSAPAQGIVIEKYYNTKGPKDGNFGQWFDYKEAEDKKYIKKGDVWYRLILE